MTLESDAHFWRHNQKSNKRPGRLFEDLQGDFCLCVDCATVLVDEGRPADGGVCQICGVDLEERDANDKRMV